MNVNALHLHQGAMTTINKMFTQKQASDPMTNYPLAIAPNTFIAGRSVVVVP